MSLHSVWGLPFASSPPTARAEVGDKCRNQQEVPATLINTFSLVPLCSCLCTCFPLCNILFHILVALSPLFQSSCIEIIKDAQKCMVGKEKEMNVFEKLELGGARAAVLGEECCGSAALSSWVACTPSPISQFRSTVSIRDKCILNEKGKQEGIPDAEGVEWWSSALQRAMEVLVLRLPGGLESTVISELILGLWAKNHSAHTLFWWIMFLAYVAGRTKTVVISFWEQWSSSGWHLCADVPMAGPGGEAWLCLGAHGQPADTPRDWASSVSLVLTPGSDLLAFIPPVVCQGIVWLPCCILYVTSCTVFCI